MLARLIGIAALAAIAASPSAVRAGQPVYVMRHLETPEGERDPDLTASGKARAERLMAWFEGKQLASIYVSDFKRTRQSVATLASSRGITPLVYDPADTPALIARVRAESRPVLIVGHSNTVPDIVEQLGGERPAPLAHPDFGDVWTLADGDTQRVKLPD